MSSHKKNLLLVTAGFPFGEWERGFLPTEFSHLCRHFSVTVLSVGREDPLLYPLEENVRVERFCYQHKKDTFRRKVELLPAFLRSSVMAEARRAVKGAALQTALSRLYLVADYYDRARQVAAVMDKLVNRQKIDILYTYWATETAVAACLLKKKHPALTFVTRFHGHDLFEERKACGWQPFRTLIADTADRLVFACEMGQSYFHSRWGGKERSALCYLGCAERPLVPHNPTDVLRIVSCSNLISLKRVECIVEALGLLPSSLKVRWDHVGDGEEAAALQRRAEKVLGENVTWTFHGHVQNHMLSRLYQELDPDVFITTSSTEGGVPVSIQEAFSMGIPAIGTAAGGIPELIVHGETGFLLNEQADAAETAAALLRYHNLSLAEKEGFSRRARLSWEQHFNAQCNAEIFVKELQQAAEC